MFGYFKGNVISIGKNFSNRFILLLEVNNIGYEIQVTTKYARQLVPDSDLPVQIFTHLQIQEDRHTLFGFASRTERDLFRQLISVSGIGTQLAIALLDTLSIPDLVAAIVSNDVKTLSKTPGVGKKTAERISLELKSKLAQWQKVAEIAITIPENTAIPDSTIREELEMTLLALAYTPDEIQSAIAAISQDQQLQANPQVEDWIREAISWLTGE